MTIDEIKKWMLESSGFPVTQANAEYLERFQAIAFKAGAASRDAEVAQWQKIIDEEAKDSALVIIERDQLRAQINVLREALTHSDTLLRYLPNSGGFYGLGVMENNAEALASIPEQSLAEYRNKVIEAFVNEFSRHVGGDGEFWLHELQYFAMKEQP